MVGSSPGAGLGGVDFPVGIYRRIPFTVLVIHKVIQDEAGLLFEGLPILRMAR